MARRVSSAEFVGRAAELAALTDALERAAGGGFSAAFVAGDSGVGKSRLLHQFEGRAQERGARVLVGGCVSLAEGELPYAPIRSALRGLLAELGSERVDELVGPGREELARLVPELGSGGGWEETATRSAQARLFDLLLAMLGRLGEEAPVVLLLEDIHWADRSTLDLIAFLVANGRRERLLLVCSYRTDELHRGHPLRTFLAQQERSLAVERIDLEPFTQVELAGQLAGILGEAPEAALVQGLHERTGGNALFAEELLAASEEGTELPGSLRDALILRIEVLPERAQETLRLAAAHGRLVTHRLLAAASELPEPELHDALREAAAHHVLVREDKETYAFRHALFQEALESDLLPGERTRFHLALAQAIEADPALVSHDRRAAAALSGHWLGAGRFSEALAAAVRAGTEAEQVYAFADASRHFQRALELWERVDDAEERAGMDRAALRARAAEAVNLSGEGSEAIGLISAAIEEVDERADPYRAAVLRERLGRYLFGTLGDTERAQRAYEEALELLPADEPREELARALAGLGQILMLRGRTAASMERCEQAIAVAREVGAGVEEAQALNTQGVNLAFLGDRTTATEYLRESVRMTEELGDGDGLARGYLNLSEILDQDGRIEESVKVALAGAQRSRELGMRERGRLLEAEAATRLFSLGRLDEVDRLTEAALSSNPSIARLAQCAARAQLEVHRGHIAEAELLIRAAEDSTANVPGATWVEPLASTRVELELLRGRPDEALRLGEVALEQAADQEKVVFTARVHALAARAAALLAERARAGGDEPAAADPAARAQALAERMGGLIEREATRGAPPPETVAYRELCAAEASRAAGTVSAAEWAAVADRWAELGMPLEEAYSRLREAECHVLEGAREPAEQAMATAMRSATDAGDVWLRNELESLARRARISLATGGAEPRATDDAVERLGLTPRELSVLELVAQGKTNRQIGEELFMSEKTASVHVSRILTKLEVGSRVEAATAAQRLGIVR